MRRLLSVLAASALVAVACSDGGGGAAAGDPGPADTVPADTAPADAVPVDTAPAETAPPDTTPPERDWSAIDPIVTDFVASHDLNGAGLIVVDRDEGVLYENYWGAIAPDRVSLIMSSSKMLVAGVLLHLQDQGLLDIDAPVADVVDWGADHPDITPAQLISNSSGLVGLFPDAGFAPYICQYAYNAGTLQSCAETIFTTPGDDDQVIPPDTEFRYGGGQWQVAGAVAEAASGKSWADLIDEIYVQPCGTPSLHFTNPFVPLGATFSYPDWDGDTSELPPTDNPNMEGGAYITLHDYGTLLLMHLRGGRCGDTQVLSQDALDRMHADRTAETYGDVGEPSTGYGMGWWVDRASGRISDPGAYGAYPWLDLEDGYGAFLLIEDTSVTGGDFARELFDPVEAAVTRR